MSKTYRAWMKIEESNLLENFKHNRALTKDVNRSMFACKLRLGKLLKQLNYKEEIPMFNIAAAYDKTEAEIRDMIKFLDDYEEKKYKANEHKKYGHDVFTDQYIDKMADRIAEKCAEEFKRRGIILSPL